MLPAIRDFCQSVKPNTALLRWTIVLCLWVVSHVVLPHESRAATPSQPSKQTRTRPTQTHLTLLPKLGIPDTEGIPFGGGAAVQMVWYPMLRFGFGAQVDWSLHGNAQFVRAAGLVQILIDDLAVKPFLEAGIGLQFRFDALRIVFSPDLHVGFGVDVPISAVPRLSIGASFQLYFPIDTVAFPITKSLHLRLRLLF